MVGTQEEIDGTPESNLTGGSPSVTFEEITFSDGTTVGLDPADVVVLVGPNNSGKSLALRELDDYFAGHTATTVLKSIELRKTGTKEDFDALALRSHSRKKGHFVSEAYLRVAPAGVAQHQVEQQVSEGLATYGDSQFRAVGEVHLRLSARRMLLLKVHLTIRPMKGSVVSDPALERPLLRPAEPARVSLVKPLQDGCRTQLTVGIGPQQRHDIALPHVRERVRSASPSPPGLLALRRQRSPLPLPRRSLAHGR